jgi:hypothetical protein
MRSRTGRSTCWDSAHSVARWPPTVRRATHQPNDADHKEQRDEVMQAAAVAVSPMYIAGCSADPPVPLDAGR